MAKVMAAIEQLGDQMSALSDAIAAAADRIAADFANMQTLLDQALATETAAVAERDALLVQAAEVQADVDATVAALNLLDPDPAFPPVEPPIA